MTQERLEQLKETARKTGPWAEYLLSETEYWAPKDLDNLTEELLQQTEQLNRDWLAENRSQYPPSGAEEEARASLTWQVKESPNCLTEDQAFEAEMMRLDGEPLEKILKSLGRKRK